MRQLEIFDEKVKTISYRDANIHQRINFKSRMEHGTRWNLLIKWVLDYFDASLAEQQYFVYMYPYHWHPYEHSLEWMGHKKTFSAIERGEYYEQHGMTHNRLING